MKTKELRLGNIVGLEYPTGIEFCKVDYINSQSAGLLTSAGNLNGANIVNIKPISLTEEWLIKFGFEYDESNNDYNIPGINESWYFTVGGDFVFKPLIAIIDDYEGCYYVHQLQNLYFALTGEELTIKN